MHGWNKSLRQSLQQRLVRDLKRFVERLSFIGIDAAMRSRKSVQPPVGADAHIAPAECTGFTEIYGEFATSKRVDVGIDP